MGARESGTSTIDKVNASGYYAQSETALLIVAGSSNEWGEKVVSSACKLMSDDSFQIYAVMRGLPFRDHQLLHKYEAETRSMVVGLPHMRPLFVG
jgi:hypothetical protein